MADKVVFYALSRKFMERQEDVPPEAKQVMYYSLAIGHHIGVIDCLKTILECPFSAYAEWVARIADLDARRKLEGVLKFGEICIDATHTQLLARALDEAVPAFGAEERGWSERLMDALRAIQAEPAMYLMVRTR